MNRQASRLFGVEQKYRVEEYIWKMEVISASETCLADGLGCSFTLRLFWYVTRIQDLLANLNFRSVMGTDSFPHFRLYALFAVARSNCRCPNTLW